MKNSLTHYPVKLIGLWLIVCLLTTVLFAGETRTSSLVYPGSDGHLKYKPYTAQGDTILDFSYCGYKKSEEPIPDVPVVETLKPLPGQTSPDAPMAYPKGPDSRKQIQDALDRTAVLPPDENGFRGAVLLTKGTYFVNGSLQIDSGVVLRGEGDGPDGTVLIVRNPKEAAVLVGDPGFAQAQVNESDSAVVIADDYIPAGSMQVTVQDASQFKTGDSVAIKKTVNDQWIKDLEMDSFANSDEDRDRPWTPDEYQLDHVRRITQVSGSRISLDVPLPQSIEKKYGGGTVRLYDLGDMDRNCGVESLRIVSNYDPSIKIEEVFADEENNIKSGIELTCVNGWARNCTVLHMRFAAVDVRRDSQYCTVRDCSALEPVSEIRGARRYPFVISGGSMTLVYKCFANDARHSFVLGSRVVGPNTFLECTAQHSYSISEPHHRWSTGVLFDKITLKEGGALAALNRGASGSGHGWAAANVVFWNSDAPAVVVFDPQTPEQNFAIGYTGEKKETYPTDILEYGNMRAGLSGGAAGKYRGYALMGTGFIESPDQPVEPASLFRQQLIDRIGKTKALQVLK